MLAPQSILRDRYTIERLLDQSDFGDLYLARDQRTDQAVEIKEIIRDTPDIGFQFERDAAILALLRHTAIPGVVEYFAVAGTRYLVTEHVPGQSLSDYLEQQPQHRLDESAAIPLLIPVLDALAYMHGRTPAFIHRDIRPANIRISPENQIFLVNFGIAGSGGIVAPGFSPPEQSFSATDARGDLYAFGATLYVLLSGAAVPAAIERVKNDPLVPLASRNPAVSPQLDALVTRLLALNSSVRYPDAATLRRDLLSVQGDQICPRCDTMNRGNARFCRKCGESLPGISPPVIAPEPQARTLNQPVAPDPRATIVDAPRSPTADARPTTPTIPAAEVPSRVPRPAPLPNVPYSPAATIATPVAPIAVPPTTPMSPPAAAPAARRFPLLLVGIGGGAIIVLLVLLLAIGRVMSAIINPPLAPTQHAVAESTAVEVDSAATAALQTADAREQATATARAATQAQTRATAAAKRSATETALAARIATAQVATEEAITAKTEAAVSAAKTAAAVPTPVPTLVPSPGTLGLADYQALVGQYKQVVFETFDRRTTDRQWPEYNDADAGAALRDNVYALTLKTERNRQSDRWSNRQLGNNYDVELAVSFQTPDAPVSAGIAFDLQGGEQLNGVTFEIFSDKHWRITTVQDGRIVPERSTGLIAETALVDGNGVNLLWVVRLPDQVQLWINSKHVGSIPSGPFDNGGAGVVSTSYTGLSSPATIFVDNFRLRTR